MDHIAKITAQLPEHGLDAMLVTSAPGERYAVGFEGEGWVLVSRDGARYSTDGRYIEAARQQVTGAEIVLTERGQSHLALAREEIRRRGLNPEVFLCTQQHGTAFRMLEGNLGYFVMKEIAAGQKGVCFAELAEPEADLEIGIVSKKNRKLSAEAKAFVRFIQKQYGESGKGIGE